MVEGTRLGAAAAHQRATLRQLAAWRDRLLQLRRRGCPVSRLCRGCLRSCEGSLAGHRALRLSSCLQPLECIPPCKHFLCRGMPNGWWVALAPCILTHWSTEKDRLPS